MASPTSPGIFNPSLFDRLTDLEPRLKIDLTRSPREQLQEVKAAIGRDLSNLLNVRRSEAEIPEEFDEVNRSIPAYGMRDFSASPVEKEQVRRAIEKSIRTFEPRLSHVTVHLLHKSPDRFEFRITAAIEIDKHSELISFDATVPIHSRRFRIDEGR